MDQKEKPAWHRVHTECIVNINPKKKPYHKGHRFYISAIAGKITIINTFAVDTGDVARESVVGLALARAKEFTDVKRMLIDAGFFKEAVYATIRQYGSDVLGIVPKNSRVVRLITSHHRALSNHYEPGIYLYRLGDVTFRLLLVPRPKEKRKISNDHDAKRIAKNYVSLAVFDAPEGIPDEFRTRGTIGLARRFKDWAFRSAEDYRKRGLIEVLLRLESLVGARVGAHYASLRFFVFGLALVIVNIYSLFDGIARYVLFLSHSFSVRVVAVFVVEWFQKAVVLSCFSLLYLCLKAVSTRPPPALYSI